MELVEESRTTPTNVPVEVNIISPALTEIEVDVVNTFVIVGVAVLAVIAVLALLYVAKNFFERENTLINT